MHEIYIKTLETSIEVSDEGRFHLPSDKEYTASELKKIAREINKASRDWDLSTIDLDGE